MQNLTRLFQEIEALNQQYIQQKIDQERQLISATQRAEERRIASIESAMNQLSQRQQAITLKQSRDAQDRQARQHYDQQQQAIKIERAELQSEWENARKVRDIRERSARQEFDLLLKRDFAGMFALRQRTSQEIQTAERSAQESAQLRQQQYRHQQADELARMAYEREQRNVRYQRELADAQTQANQRTALANATAQQAILIARQRYAEELKQATIAHYQMVQLRQTALDQEVALLSGRISRQIANQYGGFGMFSRLMDGKSAPVVGDRTVNVTINESHNIERTWQTVMNVLDEVWGK
jgi:hypothetical protein